ncbi:MAG: ABC transporter ATP-binding protein [Gammaproteobacteria bacterium]|nr:ABC transporter ATP-binding protein [Gammaproteobacteria bacterium]
MDALRRLIPFVKPYQWRVYAAFVTFFIARFFEINTIYLVSYGIDTVKLMLEDKPTDFTLGQIAAGIVGCVFGRFIFVVHARRAVRRVGVNVSYDLRRSSTPVCSCRARIFLAYGCRRHHDPRDPGHRPDPATGGLRFDSARHHGVRAAVCACLYAVEVGVADRPDLAAVAGAVFLRQVHVAANGSGLAQHAGTPVGLSAHVQENLGGIRTVQAMAQEENEIERSWGTNDAYRRAFYHQARIQSLMSAWMPFFAAAAQLVIVTYGGWLVMQGSMTVGDLMFFLFGINMLLQPIRMAGTFVTLIQRARGRYAPPGRISMPSPRSRIVPSGKTPEVIQGEFDLRHLTYTYPRAEEPVLRDINLHVEAGESIGIVGRVGAGKSTLLEQFTRMSNTNRGQLFLDGHDICDYPLSQLRSQIAQVLPGSFPLW